MSPGPEPPMSKWDEFVNKASHFMFWPLFVAYLVGGMALAFSLVNFFSNLKAFNASLHSVLLVDVWLGALAGVTSLAFIYLYYGGASARGMRDLALLEALYWKIKACPRDLSVSGPSRTDRARAATNGSERNWDGRDHRAYSLSRTMLVQVDDDAIARAVELAETDRRITLRWTAAEVFVVVTGFTYLMVRLVDDGITIKPLWDASMEGRVPFWVYSLASLFFQGTNAVAVVFHALHCLALASVLDLLARRIRGGAVPVVKYMQLALDYMHLLRSHNRMWGRAVTLTVAFYTFEGVLTLFESIVFRKHMNPLLLLVTIVDYVLIIPLLLVPPSLIRHYAHKVLDCNNICRLLLISFAQRTREAILDGEDPSEPLLLAGRPSTSSWEQPFRWHSSLAAINIQRPGPGAHPPTGFGDTPPVVERHRRRGTRQFHRPYAVGAPAAAASAAAAAADRTDVDDDRVWASHMPAAGAGIGAAARWAGSEDARSVAGSRSSLSRGSVSLTDRASPSESALRPSAAHGGAADLAGTGASTPGSSVRSAPWAAEDNAPPTGPHPHAPAQNRSQSALSQEEEARRSHAAEAAYTAMWTEIGAIDSFAIMIQTSRVYARILNIPMTIDLIGKFYSLVFSVAYVFSRVGHVED